MTILLLGGAGQLGQTFVEDGGLAAIDRLAVATRSGSLNGERCAQADLADPVSLKALLEGLSPAIIINAAAYTAVDQAEQEEDLAMRINGEALAVIGQWAAKRGALVLHYSTDYVFDGAGTTPYAPDAPTAPLGAYGRSKLAGEQALAGSGAAHMIMRTGWVYAPHGSNFLLAMLRLGRERDEIRVVADQIGAPTSTDLIVQASMAAIDRWLGASPEKRHRLEGIHHLVASGQTSWHGFAEAIMQQASARGLIAKAPNVIPTTTAEFPTPAARPAFSVLDNADFIRTFGFELPNWEQGLDQVLQQLC